MTAVTEARASMWRTRLYGKKALPGDSGCPVLVTSRKRLAASKEVVLPVVALPKGHAVELFLRLSGRPADSLKRAVVEQLVGLCGCLPLAISLLAARLRHHQSWSADNLRSRLLVARDPLAELRAGERAEAAAFELSSQGLDAERQHFFRLLGFYAGTDLDAYAGGAVASVSVAEARSRLEELYEAHLIDEQPGDRYRLYDLLHGYARGRVLALEQALAPGIFPQGETGPGATLSATN
ncbi:hypothetical protein ACFV13_12135 [Streptomyces bauhiniae]|uniref:hypothetical protein n=1 Tax=Streptomyces bauhiniae TaxID=2340725 RepID=UPI0036D0A244